MALTAKLSGGKDFDPIKAGVHFGCCFAIYDLGTTYDERYSKTSHKIVVMWEVPSERIEVNGEDLPRAISKRYTLSLHEKASLRKDLEGIRGQAFTDKELEGFDLKNVLGSTAQLQVLHVHKDGKTYANVGSVMGLPPGTQPLKPENELKWFSLEESMEIPEVCPEWVAKLIKESDEWKGSAAISESEPDKDEDNFDMGPGKDEPDSSDLPF